MTLAEIETQAIDWMEEALILMGLPDVQVIWMWNKRLTRTMGRTKLALHPTGVWMVTRIELSPCLFEIACVDEQRSTVVHEIAHLADAAYGTFNPRQMHSASWERLMRVAGEDPKIYHSVGL